MSKRPPIKPQQHFKRKSDSDEEKDEVGELGMSFPVPRQVRNYAPVPIESCFDRVFFLGPIPIYYSGSSGPIFLALHGAGLSASSYGPAALLSKKIPCQLISFDFRGHGQNNDTVEETNMETELLVSETLQVLNYIRDTNPGTQIVVVGHSMGGAIASKACLQDQNLGGKISGLIILDVVEGSAIDALPHMDSIVSQRPKNFRSVEQAIQWAVNSNTIKNLNSAKISVPLQVRPCAKGFEFRTDLKNSKIYWEGWFRGMNNAFLGVHAPKQLIVAGSDRTDRQMMIAQMQGKFKHTVFFDVGHILHEDNPERFVDELKAFIDTFKVY
jgi:protein phosphatase methylesterase 1